MEDIIKVGIWIRVSTDKQMSDESPEHHEQRAIQYINAKGWKLKTVYRLSGISGKTIMEHSETQRMLRDIRCGQINGLVFSRLARLARNTRELLEIADVFRNAKASLISLSENIDTSTPPGMLFFTVMSALAEWEREEISARVSESVPVRANLGKPLGGPAIFGYSWQNRKFVINEAEAPIRKLIYDIFLRTRGKKTTADELNRLGYRTRRGALFSDTTVDRLLKDTTAKGERIANYTKGTKGRKRTVLKPRNEWVITKCPPVISRQVWNKVNGILGEQERKSTRIGRRRSVYLLSGFVKCLCSKKMYVKGAKVYCCKSCRIKIAVGNIEEIYWKYLSDCLMNIKMLESSRSSNIIQNKMADEQVRIKYRDALFTRIDDFIRDWNSMPFERKRSAVDSVTKQVLVSEKEVRIIFSINLLVLFHLDYEYGGNIQMLPCLRYECITKKPAPICYPDAPVSIGEHIRKRRMELQLFQKDVAKICGVTEDCIANWEKNRSTPQIIFYPKIIEFLAYSPLSFDETKISGRIKAYRYRNGITSKMLGKLQNIDPSTVSDWENGNCIPSPKNLLKLEALFGQSSV
ncbi:recombinase family protein [Pedobacter sp. ASV12]|uniref:recombinase family protein n=1 Tax=Pedobacter sp. ASV12 TaxID=2795120 RepID=UPI0018ECBA93|nr:recombinase family protein [Pedobacter sp. ASV12]